MRIYRNSRLLLDNPGSDERRRYGRLRCENATSCIGKILDISASGMRVLRRGRLLLEVGNELSITVHPDPDAGEPFLTLPSRVVWIERVGFRKHMYGIEFAELSDEQKRRLSELARVVCDQMVFRCAS
jgi:c-di-GMP-binding flagellar brake protein YcgR